MRVFGLHIVLTMLLLHSLENGCLWSGQQCNARSPRPTPAEGHVKGEGGGGRGERRGKGQSNRQVLLRNRTQ
jgi:hypothetical protein